MLGQIGIWRPHQVRLDDLSEIEELGFGAFWVGGSPSLAQVRPFLEATSAMTIATGILNIWQHQPADVAAGHAELTRDFPGRFLLGVGVGHPEAFSDYAHPLKAMREFFDGLDAAEPPVPSGERLAAALGPKMLDLAGQRSLGTHPYFTTPDHTRFARARLGPAALVAPEVAVVLDGDPRAARERARVYAALYLGLRNYTTNLLGFGFTQADIADGGSDRLIDAVIPHGTPEQVARAVQEHLEAGADHVCLQPLGPGSTGRARHAGEGDYRALAEVLL